MTNTWAPESCTLPTTERPLRQAEFDHLFATSVQSVHRLTPTTLSLTLPTTAQATAESLTTRESTCCTFFTFTFTPTSPTTLALRIEVPNTPTHLAVLDALESHAKTHQT